MFVWGCFCLLLITCGRFRLRLIAIDCFWLHTLVLVVFHSFRLIFKVCWFECCILISFVCIVLDCFGLLLVACFVLGLLVDCLLIARDLFNALDCVPLLLIVFDFFDRD